MKKVIMLALCLCLTSVMSFGQLTLNNDWNKFTKVSNQIIDTKVHPSDGIYYIEKEINLVPYVQGGDTLYGTKDSCSFLKKVSFNGTLVWSKSFPKQDTFSGTIGEPFQIHVISDGIILFCNWGIAKYSFNGTLAFTTIFPQSAFDPYGFAGGGPNVDYMFLHRFFGCAQPVVEFNQDTLCVLGRLGRSADTTYVDSSMVFTMIDPLGNIIGERVINRQTNMGVTYDATTKLFYCASITDSVRIETMDIRTGQTEQIFSLPLWGADKDIRYFFKTASGFAMITERVNTTTNFIQLTSLYPGQQISMAGSLYYQQNPNMRPVLDEFISCERNADVFYITAEDGELIRWGIGATANNGTLQTRNPFVQGEIIYGSPRLILLGNNKLAYVTNDSITASNNVAIKAATIRIFSQSGLVELVKDSLPDYSINQFDLSVIDSVSFCFGGWLGVYDPAILSKWSLDQQITTGMMETKTPLDINMYPNPATTFINITVDPASENEVTIIDITGRVVLTEVYHGTIDVSTFSKGTYLVRIKKEGHYTTKKLIIQ